MRYSFTPQYICPQNIQFDLNGDVVSNISFYGGRNGNLKMVSKLVDGWTVDKIEEYMKGNLCGRRPTSCADQLAIAVREALEAQNGATFENLQAAEA